MSMKSIIGGHLVEFLKGDNFFAGEQHVFRDRKSCTTYLLETLQDWTYAVDGGAMLIVFFMITRKHLILSTLKTLGLWGVRRY